MAFSYDISANKKDTKSGTCLMVTHLMGNVVKLFVSTFLVAYMYTYATSVYDYIFNVALYYLTCYAVLPIVFWILSYFIEKSNRVWFYRVGLILRCALVVLLVFCGQNISKLIILSGVLRGVSEGFYYSSYNVIRQEMVSRKSVKKYTIILQSLSKITDIIIPIVMGALIEVSTYGQVSILVAAICVIQLGISFGIKAQRPTNSLFSMSGYIKKLKANPELARKMKYSYVGSLLAGFKTMLTLLISVTAMIEFGSSFSLGALTSVFACLSIITILLVTRFTTEGKRGWLFYSSIVIAIVGTTLYAIYPCFATVVAYNACLAISEMISSTFYEQYKNCNLKEAGLYSEISEHQTLSEILLCTTRVISFGALMIIAKLNNLLAFKISIIVFGLLAASVLIYLAMYEKKFMRFKTTENCLMDNHSQKCDCKDTIILD